MSKTRYLTKSRFKLAHECPAKLFYSGKNEYADRKNDDTFLKSLAEGGFQVGELAKLYYPDGYNVSARNNEQALEETKTLLQQENVTLFEAAISYKNLLIRIDVLVKRGNNVELIEVKAKSTDTVNPDDFFKKNGSKLDDTFKPYLYDAVFQKYVLAHAFPQFNVSAYLMLADKTQRASIDGLNQRFLLKKDEKGRSSAVITDFSDTGTHILSLVNVDSIAEFISQTTEEIEDLNLSFEQYIHYLADAYEADRKINYPIGDYCAKCEFTATPENEAAGLKNGFKECWKKQTMLKENDFTEPLIFELWDFKTKQKAIKEGIIFLKDIPDSYFKDTKEENVSGLSRAARQMLQRDKVRNGDGEPYIDRDGLRQEMASWKFPLHMIDFETSQVAIPFNKGRRPYEAIAFQFSHHVIYEDGSYEHKGEYLNMERGVFPNFDFVRALKKELENDEGSVFRYAPHENTILCKIHEQLSDDVSEIPDRDELKRFIETITYKKDDKKKIIWEGSRAMIDLWKIVKRYYYHPSMRGSNSIKVVLPAILDSTFIKNKYSLPIYGAANGIKSLNFPDMTWIVKDESGNVKSPYKLLPPLFEDVDEEMLDDFITDPKLADGGAAMTAYARMQFSEMTDSERNLIGKGLLRYCELDTLAMVMIWEYFSEEVKY
jgi:hypothetical protein